MVNADMNLVVAIREDECMFAMLILDLISRSSVRCKPVLNTQTHIVSIKPEIVRYNVTKKKCEDHLDCMYYYWKYR